MGSRAYLARSRAQQQHKILRAARQSGVSTMGPSSGSGGRRSSSFGAAVGASLLDDDDMSETGPGPMAGGVIASRQLPNSHRAAMGGGGAGPMMGGSAPHVSVTNPEGGTTMTRASRSNSQGSNVRFHDDHLVDADADELNEAQPAARTHGGMWSSGTPRLGDEERAGAGVQDPFEDQRGGYYGYENEAGLTSERDRRASPLSLFTCARSRGETDAASLMFRRPSRLGRFSLHDLVVAVSHRNVLAPHRNEP